MSYILDALARSQRESELGQVPTPTSHACPPPATPRDRTGRLLLLLTLLASALAATTYGVLLWQGDNRHRNLPTAEQPGIGGPQTPTADPTAPPVPAEAASDRLSSTPAPATPPAVVVQPSTADTSPAKPAATPVTDTEPAVQRPSGHIAPAPGTVSPRQPPAAPDAPRVTDTRSADTDAMRQELLALQYQLRQREREEQEQKQADRKQAARSAPDETVSPTPTERDSTAHGADRQLPPEVYRRLPPRQLSVVAYAKDPQRRFVIINSQKLTEGSRSKEGLTVEQIHQDSVTFGFEGYRFRDWP